jgi:hypothetical protein
MTFVSSLQCDSLGTLRESFIIGCDCSRWGTHAVCDCEGCQIYQFPCKLLSEKSNPKSSARLINSLLIFACIKNCQKRRCHYFSIKWTLFSHTIKMSELGRAGWDFNREPGVQAPRKSLHHSFYISSRIV